MTEVLREYYAKRASEYDRVYEKAERRSDLDYLRRLVGETFGGLDVLEQACGTGYWTQVLGSTAKSVLACDINEAVLKIARAKNWNGAAVEFQIADSFRLPDFSGRFSGGFAGFWWSHVPKRRVIEFLISSGRNLRRGATVMFIDNRYIEGHSTPISSTDVDGNTYQRRKLQDETTFEVLKNFPSPEELLQAANQVGSAPEVTLLDFYWVLTYKAK